MKVKASAGGDFERPKPGTYMARCVGVVDLGTQEFEFSGQKGERRQIIVKWELPTELVTKGDYAGQPLVITKFYTFSLNEKANLRHDLVSWRGREFSAEDLRDGFDVSKLLGVPCLVTITSTETDRVKVAAVAQPPKGTKVPPQVNPSVLFDLEAFDGAVFAGLQDWVKDIIRRSPEFAALENQAPMPGEDDDYHESDSIPF